MKRFLAVLIGVFLLIALPGPLALAESRNAGAQRSALNEADFSAFMTREIAEKNGHTIRLYGQESDLNSVVYLNDDGTQTMYCYSQPVKYVDAEGVIRDRSTALVSRADGKYAFANQNDVVTSIPKSLTAATPLQVEGYGMRLAFYPHSSANVSEALYATQKDSYAARRNDNQIMPRTENPVSFAKDVNGLVAEESVRTAEAASVSKQADDTVHFAKAFAPNTTMEYQLDIEGVKENILLYSADAPTVYSFVLLTNGAPLKQSEKGLIITNGTEAQGAISPVVVFDSGTERHYSHATLTQISEVRPDEEYRITYILDKAYLSDPETVYPVVVDPSVTITYQAQTSTKYIQDAVVYAGAPTTAAGTWQYAHVGYESASYKEGVLVIRMPGMFENSVVKTLANNYSVKLCLYEGSGKVTASKLSVRRGMVPTWQESTVTYNTVGRLDGPKYSETTVNQTNRFIELDFTARVAEILSQAGSTPTNSINAGLIVRNENATSTAYDKCFSTTERSVASERPYIKVITSGATIPSTTEVTYYRIHNVSTGKLLNASPLGVTDYAGVLSEVFIFFPLSNGRYHIVLANQFDAKKRVLDGFSSTLVSTVIFDKAMGPEWQIVPTGDGQCRLYNPYYNRRIGVNSSGGLTFSSAPTNDLWYLEKINFCLLDPGYTPPKSRDASGWVNFILHIRPNVYTNVVTQSAINDAVAAWNALLPLHNMRITVKHNSQVAPGTISDTRGNFYCWMEPKTTTEDKAGEFLAGSRSIYLYYNKTGWGSSIFAKNVIMHEIGHYLGLDHYGTSKEPRTNYPHLCPAYVSIMYFQATSSVLMVPSMVEMMALTNMRFY